MADVQAAFAGWLNCLNVSRASSISPSRFGLVQKASLNLYAGTVLIVASRAGFHIYIVKWVMSILFSSSTHMMLQFDNLWSDYQIRHSMLPWLHHIFNILIRSRAHLFFRIPYFWSTTFITWIPYFWSATFWSKKKTPKKACAINGLRKKSAHFFSLKRAPKKAHAFLCAFFNPLIAPASAKKKRALFLGALFRLKSAGY